MVKEDVYSEAASINVGAILIAVLLIVAVGGYGVMLLNSHTAEDVVAQSINADVGLTVSYAEVVEDISEIELQETEYGLSHAADRHPDMTREMIEKCMSPENELFRCVTRMPSGRNEPPLTNLEDAERMAVFCEFEHEGQIIYAVIAAYRTVENAGKMLTAYVLSATHGNGGAPIQSAEEAERWATDPSYRTSCFPNTMVFP